MIYEKALLPTRQGHCLKLQERLGVIYMHMERKLTLSCYLLNSL